jgi:hypothetical protein
LDRPNETIKLKFEILIQGKSMSANIEQEYSSHKEQILQALPSKERLEQVETAILKAYHKVISYQEIAVVAFGELNAEELAEAFFKYPLIIKATLACVNVAGRAIKRDLGINVDTYGISITELQASLLAGYIKPFLPATVALPALMELDRFFWTDKEMRAKKGQWEKTVTTSLISASGLEFKKRRFQSGSDPFYELDAAYPAEGENIEIGVDIKRIEATQDTMKRGDEIINKADKFKATFPKGIFIAIVYFPFPAQHINFQTRLQSAHIDHLFFAGESLSSISACTDLIVGTIHQKKNER